MAHIKTKWCIAAVALVTAAGCHDDHASGSSSSPPGATTSVDFVAFVKQIFPNDQNSIPINLANITFDFSDEDPTAFDGLLM